MSRSEEFVDYAEWASDQSALYEQLGHECATDETLLDLVEEAPESQPAPHLLFGAVHDLLLQGVDHELASFYHTRTDQPRDPTETDLFPVFRDFCLAYESDIRERLESRLVQTNAVGRSAMLYPAFASVADQSRGPLALIEIGPSAGLNLLWDRYRYEYDDRVVGNTDSAVVIDSGFRGDSKPPLPETPPKIASRVGIDLNPLDVTDPDDAHWLRSLIPPNHQYRHERLRGALEHAAENPPDLIQGNAVERLPDCLADLPADATCCVFSTIALYQFPEEAVNAIRETLAEFSQSRTVHWLSGDPAVDVTTPTYRHAWFEDGEMRAERLAEFEAYGSWIEWEAY